MAHSRQHLGTVVAAPVPLRWLGLTLFALWTVASLLIGEAHPFSLYSMYAASSSRDEGAVPVFQADGKTANLFDFTVFSGINPGEMLPHGIPCSQVYRVEEAKAWIAAHSSFSTPIPMGKGARRVSVRYGYMLLKVNSQGVLQKRFQWVASGTAWKR